MGITYVTLDVGHPQRPNGFQRMEFLVDTGAVYTIMPERVLKRLGIQPIDQERFRLANGRTIARSVGEARFRYHGKTRISPVVFGRAHDKVLLGVMTLEALGLEVDPRTRKLKPAELLLLTVIRQ
ncbi:MAG: clan AA aspartic protease [Candidatus Omnitrophica bacterium]|nr:clan AA aspartic protease [Candidatus Omnitrophota bacterium]MBI2495461.1 clan AA aspartic protease [Candidatus Omnitrophota bacterium]MBI3020496.1 clan AA aspartic protease [Candidatus Omnitrophota bacterium]